MYIPLDNTIAITVADYMAAGFSYFNFKNDKQRKYLVTLNKGGNGREVLIDFNSIKKADRRAAIIRVLGEPTKEAGKTPYANEIRSDAEAITYYHDYTYNEDKHLPEEAKMQYANEAAILNTIKRVMDTQRAARARHGKKKRMGEFWDEATTWVTSESTILKWPHKLPTNARTLERKYSAYLEDGYYSLIHKGYGNGNADRLTEEGKRWLIARFGTPIEKLTTKQLFEEYNRIAPERGWMQLKTELTVYKYLHLPEVQPIWWGMRYGELAAKEKFNRQHRTLLPTMRDSIWYSDGTKLNYYYRTEDGKIETCTVYEVIDAYSECFLGYHISKSEDFEAQYYSYRMALQFAKQRPYEIRYDNQGGHKKLENGGFLQKMAHLAINTMPYNGKSKTIESAFGRFQAEYLHREWYFTGQNITAKKEESRQNMEFILANKTNLPTLDEVKAKYKQRRDAWNKGNHFDTGKPRIEMYRESVNPKAQKMEWFEMLEIFGIMTDKPNTYRASGIEIQVKNIKYAYEVLGEDGQPDTEFLESNVDRKFFVKYDPNDMSIVSLFVKDHAGLRFVTLAGKYLHIHRGKQEQEEHEPSFIKQQELIGKERRLARQENIEQMMESEGVHPAQNGLNMPKVAGVTPKFPKKDLRNSKRATKMVATTIGEELKKESYKEIEQYNLY